MINRKVKNLRELKVTLVVRGNGHNRARTVSRENIVGNENRQLIAIDGIYARNAVETDARFLFVKFRALQIALRGGLFLVLAHSVGVLNRTVGKPLFDKLMLRGKHHVRRTEKRIATRRVNGNRVTRRLEIDESAG